MTVLSEILDWAATQDDWKQDAIRRVIENGGYEKQDVNEIKQILLYKNGYLEKAPFTIRRFDASKIKTTESISKNKVILQKIESPLNINSLSAEGKLQFALDGLTIIYGENGAGKSGYSRILKKTCKARETDTLFKNVFAKGSDAASEVTLFYSNNGIDKKVQWIDGGDTQTALDQLVVYDSKCAKIQVTDKNELIYLPHGTDIFKKLIDCLLEVRTEIEKEKPKEVKLNFDNIDQSTRVFKVISAINKKTSKEDIEGELKWDNTIEEVLSRLSRMILDANEAEIKKKIAYIDKDLNLLADVEEVFRTLEVTFTEEKRLNLKNLKDLNLEYSKALEELKSSMDRNDLVAGTGDELWRLMYDAAKKFAAESAFNNADVDLSEINCVLCQQTLSPAAHARMKTFTKFAEGQVKKRLEENENLVIKALKYLEALLPKFKNLKNNIELMGEVLNVENKEKLEKHITNLENSNNAWIKFLKDQACIIGPIESVSCLQILEQAKMKSTQLKENIQKTLDPKYLKELSDEKLELEAIKIFHNKKNEIFRYLDYLRDSERYSEMLSSLDTTQISRKGNSIITESLKQTFLKSLELELFELGGANIPLSVSSSTKEGKPTFQLSLEAASMPARCKIDHILSEGEQKIASLAGLLAELDTAKHCNGLVLDDPVTSLDHHFRNKIAERLVVEAKKRQVIIFTHDLSFLFDLQHHAILLKVPTLMQNIRKDGAKAGIIFNTNPWHAQSVKDRISTLRTDLDEIVNNVPVGEAYNQIAGIFYGRLRETWERTIEECLFNEVVMRLNQGVQTNRLNGVVVEHDDFIDISLEMAKCSKFLIGHDKCLPLSEARPPIAEIEKDFSKIKVFIKKVNSRREDIIKIRKLKVEVPPAAKVLP